MGVPLKIENCSQTPIETNANAVKVLTEDPNIELYRREDGEWVGGVLVSTHCRVAQVVRQVGVFDSRVESPRIQGRVYCLAECNFRHKDTES